jgi:GT2 family glycosyltransferase
MAGRASGDFLLFLNNDATLLPDALQVLMDAASDSASPGILGLPQYDMESGALLDRGSLLDPFFNPVPNLDPEQSNVAMIMGACLWVPRPLWEEIGGFPEWLHTLAEDMYLCLVARVLGYDIKVLDRSGYRHRVGHSLGGGKVREGALRTRASRRRMSERNKTFVMVVCLPALMLGMLLPIHLLLLFLEGMLLSAIKLKNIWSDVYSFTFKSLWFERERLMKERKKVQSKREAGFMKMASIFVWYPYKLKMLLFHGLPTIEK